MYLSLKWYMVIIRLRLQSIPICFFHTGPHWPTIKFTASRHPIPHLYWEWRILKAVVFSVKFWLIDAALSLHFKCGVKRLHPERVTACSLLFLRNELMQSISFSCAQNAKDSRHFQTASKHEAPSDKYKQHREQGCDFYSDEHFQCKICTQQLVPARVEKMVYPLGRLRILSALSHKL